MTWCECLTLSLRLSHVPTCPCGCPEKHKWLWKPPEYRAVRGAAQKPQEQLSPREANYADEQSGSTTAGKTSSVRSAASPGTEGWGAVGLGSPTGRAGWLGGVGLAGARLGNLSVPPVWGCAATGGGGRRRLEGDSRKRWFGPQLVAAQSLLSHLSISRDRDPSLGPAWGSSSSVPRLDPIQAVPSPLLWGHSHSRLLST